MDWPKAKSILIIGFLLADLYLGWLLYAQSHINVVDQLTEADAQGLVTLARHYGVELLAMPEPLQVGRAKAVSMREQPDGAAVALAAVQRWLGAGATSGEPVSGSLTYRQGQWQLRVRPGRYITELYLDLLDAPTTGTLGDPEESRQLAREFLEAHLGSEEMAQYQPGLVQDDAATGLQVIAFYRLYQGLPSFTDCYRVQVKADQVVGFAASQSQLDTPTGARLQLVAADRPLRRYLAQVGAQSEPITLHELRLGLGLLPGEEQTLQPVWRLSISTPTSGQSEVLFPAAVSYWGVDSR